MSKSQKVLFSSSEALPFVKTGGLADVAGSLPNSLSKLGADVSLILPAYRVVLDKTPKTKQISSFKLSGFRKEYEVKLLEAPIKNSKVKAWLVDIPELFDRPDGIYLAKDGKDWWDNGERFSMFSKAVVEIAMDRVKLNWKADVVHNNDWQTGLVSALISLENNRPRTVFTIHNMAYQGNFPYGVFAGLELPHHWWHEDAIEFYGNMSMLKAGIMFSDKVTTVSPTYAKEICTAEFAYGFEGIMNKCLAEGRLTGVLNGIDEDYWNPEKDDLIPYNYSINSKLKENKAKNKLALLHEMNAPDSMLEPDVPLFGLIGRLVEQKGIDLVLSVLPDLLAHSNANFIFLGSGDSHFEHSLKSFTQHYPNRILTYIGYSEALAHKIEAGVDMFLMPSRFEPCGLNQMYSLAYGTMPIVHHTGGLADTVVNATTENIVAKQATGFVFYDQTSYGLKETMYYAISIFEQKDKWLQIQKTAMSQNNSWENSAKAYFDLYTVKD